MGALVGIARPAPRRVLRIGSLSLLLTAECSREEDLLAFVFKQRVRDVDQSFAIDGSLSLQVDETATGWAAQDRLSVETSGDGTLTVATDIVAARLDRRDSPFSLVISVRPNDFPEPYFCTHLSVVMNRVLLALGRAYLHSAAVAFGGRHYLFVGDKAAGKSTLCLTLGRLGAEILSDDHVVVRRHEQTYLVSGCEETSRVTPRTEAFIFGQLDVESQDFGGMVKKEFDVDRFFRLSAYVDFPIHRVFFSRVGRTLRVRPMSRQAATIELIEKSRALYRFQDAADLDVFLDFWTSLAESIPAYDLELSETLTDLEHLPALLEA